jgi:hypothetical protein
LCVPDCGKENSEVLREKGDGKEEMENHRE